MPRAKKLPTRCTTVYVPIAPLADIADQQLRAYDAVVGGITSTLEQRDAARPDR